MGQKHTTLRQAWENFPPYKKVRLIGLGNCPTEELDEIQATDEFPIEWQQYADCQVCFINYYLGTHYFYITKVVEE